MHHTQHMLEPHVFSRRKHPPGCLQLVNLSQTLHPRMINQFLLRRLTRRQALTGDERDVAVNGIVRQAF